MRLRWDDSLHRMLDSMRLVFMPMVNPGGLLLGTVETFVNGSQWSTYKDAIAFAILIGILLFRPAGLLGKFTVEKV